MCHISEPSLEILLAESHVSESLMPLLEPCFDLLLPRLGDSPRPLAPPCALADVPLPRTPRPLVNQAYSLPVSLELNNDVPGRRHRGFFLQSILLLLGSIPYKRVNLPLGRSPAAHGEKPERINEGEPKQESPGRLRVFAIRYAHASKQTSLLQSSSYSMQCHAACVKPSLHAALRSAAVSQPSCPCVARNSCKKRCGCALRSERGVVGSCLRDRRSEPRAK